MATIKLKLDKRRESEHGYPVVIWINQRDTNTTEDLFCLEEKYWAVDKNPLRPVKSAAPGAQAFNDSAERAYMKYSKAILELKQSGLINSMKASDIKEYANRGNITDKPVAATNNTANDAVSFTSSAEAYIKTVRADKTREAYRYTLNKLQTFSGKETLTFDDITLKFLREFEAWLEQSGSGTNTRGIHFRNIRAIFNRAIDDEETTLYPFRKFEIKKVKKEVQAISIEQIQEIYCTDFSTDKGLRIARDIY